MKTTLDAHPSVTIAYCKNKLLMAVYDGSYPQVSYRFSANNIGGNPGKEDYSPKDTVKREISEEFDPLHGELTKFKERVLWAKKEDINLIKHGLIDKLIPYQDFLVNTTQLSYDKTTHTYTAIYSTFIAEVSPDVIECAEANLRRIRRFTTEGLSGVFTLEELTYDPVKKELSTAHGSAPILNHFFYSKIPHPSEIKANPIGNVRDLYCDYLPDFIYNEIAWKH